MDVIIYDDVGNVCERLYQWDIGKTILLAGTGMSTNDYIYIGTVNGTQSLRVKPDGTQAGMLQVYIPNVALQQDKPLVLLGLNVGIFAKIPIAPRTMPNNYAPTDDSDRYYGDLSSIS